MARLVPSIETINKFPAPLTLGERALMDALLKILDDDWVIYVQPFLNGLQPDIIIFSEEAGMGIFEVKDWDLSSYRVQGGYWDVFDSRQGGWVKSAVRSPLDQVQGYKDSIYQYELPELGAEKTLDKRVYSLIAPFVYFHRHTTQDARARLKPAEEPYITVFGYDDLQPDRLRSLLGKQYLRKGSSFAGMMKRYELQNRLLNALDWPEHGRLEISDILFSLTPDQQRLLGNSPGKRRVIGVAGSGKTMLLARKAVDAALSDQRVLIVCFNLTMVNYLNDVVRRLVRYKSNRGREIIQLILVRHYHRLYPDDIKPRKQGDEIALKDEAVIALKQFDVILIDEGQDFKREWIERLYDLTSGKNAHIMFVEDDRQNIYGIDTKARGSVPGIMGRPNVLKRSFRINRDVAALANRLIAWSEDDFESGDVEAAPPIQKELVPWPKPVWAQGDAQAMMDSLNDEVRCLFDQVRSGAFADLAILVCTVEDGWSVCDGLEALKLPYVCNFESRDEYDSLAQNCSGEQLKEQRERIRRGRKVAFQMQTGSVKVCTIHSFKGWELKRVLVYFRPTEKQAGQKIELLYTAITRTQDSLAVFNADLELSEFGRLAGEEGLVEFHEPDPDWVNRPQPEFHWFATPPPTRIEPDWEDWWDEPAR